MILSKLAKTGALVLTGAVIGGVLPYASQKTEIIDGINNIKNVAISAKSEVNSLNKQKEDLEKNIDDLNSQITTEK